MAQPISERVFLLDIRYIASAVTRGICFWPLMLLIYASPIFSALAASAQYLYDGGGRLVQVVAPDGSSARYQYDAAGNITSVERLASTTVAVSSFAPASGPAGTGVKVSGSGFSTSATANTVTLNGVTATVTASSANSLTFAVPASATSGKISVTTSNGTATSKTDFVVSGATVIPSISSISPTVGTTGTSLTVTGSGFQTQTSDNLVRVGGTLATVGSAAAATLVSTVGAATVTGKVKVETRFGSALSAQTFYVPPGTYTAADVVASGAVTTGVSQSVAIGTAGKIAMYSFEGSAGQRMSVLVTSSTFTSCSSGSFRLYDPAGKQLDFTNLCNNALIEPVALSATGTYSLVVIPTASSSGSLAFTLNNIQDVVGMIAVDDAAVSLTTNTAAQNMKLTFSGSAGQRVALTVSGASSFSNYTIDILNPDGSSTAFSGFGAGSSSYFSDLVTLTQTGTHTIVFNPSAPGNTRVGSATFVLKSVPTDAAAAIVVDGAAVTLTTTTAAQNMMLTFNGSVGQRVALTISGASSFSYYTIKIFNPDGSTTVFSNAALGSSSYFSDLITLTQAGTHTIVFNPSSTGATQVGAATFTLKTVAADAVGTITVDGPANTLTTTTAAQNMMLTFSGSVGQRVALTISGASSFSYYTIKIFNPDGSTTVFSNAALGSSSYFSDLITLTQAGTHTIVFNPSSTGATQVGAATFTLKTVAADAVGTITVDGPAKTLTTTTPAQNMKMTFAGTSGQRVSLAISGASAFAYYGIGILSPDGSTYVLNTASNTASYSSGAKTLSQTGTHTIIFDPKSTGATSVGSATFTLTTPP